MRTKKIAMTIFPNIKGTDIQIVRKITRSMCENYGGVDITIRKIYGQDNVWTCHVNQVYDSVINSKACFTFSTLKEFCEEFQKRVDVWAIPDIIINQFGVGNNAVKYNYEWED